MPLFYCAAASESITEMTIPQALVFSVISMLVVFSLLALLWGMISIMKIFCYTIPNRKKEAAKKAAEAPAKEAAPAPAVQAPAAVSAAPAEAEEDEAELVAVFAAAIAALEGTSPSGFVVRSFRRADRSGWTGTGRREAVDKSRF